MFAADFPMADKAHTKEAGFSVAAAREGLATSRSYGATSLPLWLFCFKLLWKGKVFLAASVVHGCS